MVSKVLSNQRVSNSRRSLLFQLQYQQWSDGGLRRWQTTSTLELISVMEVYFLAEQQPNAGACHSLPLGGDLGAGLLLSCGSTIPRASEFFAGSSAYG